MNQRRYELNEPCLKLFYGLLKVIQPGKICWRDTIVYGKMNSNQTITLNKIVEDLIRSDIVRNDIESLFRGLGGEIAEDRGSRVRVKLNGIKSSFYPPTKSN